MKVNDKHAMSEKFESKVGPRHSPKVVSSCPPLS
jgi:hypothetical protein